MLSAGEVAEWSNVPDSKSGVVATSPWVRIPPSPPEDFSKSSELLTASQNSLGSFSYQEIHLAQIDATLAQQVVSGHHVKEQVGQCMVFQIGFP